MEKMTAFRLDLSFFTEVDAFRVDVTDESRPVWWRCQGAEFVGWEALDEREAMAVVPARLRLAVGLLVGLLEA